VSLIINYIFKSILLPPGIILIFMIMGISLLWFRPVLAKIMLGATLVFFYLFSTPYISHKLIHQLQNIPALNKDKIVNSGAGVIVVLSSGRYLNSPEYGHDTVDESTLIRLRYGVYLHRMTGLPILVTGGYVIDHQGDSLAKVMADTLKKDYGITNVWQENLSSTTAENAIFSKKILDGKDIKRILLVTHAWHMPRSLSIFQKTGFKVIPAPTMYLPEYNEGMIDFLPSAGAFMITHIALHEMIGQIWYLIRY